MARRAQDAAEAFAGRGQAPDGDAFLETLLASDRPVALLTPQGQVSWANQAVLDLTGYKRFEELLERLPAFVDQRDSGRLAEAAARMRTEGLDACDLVIDLLDAGDERVDVRVELLAAREGSGELVYIVARLRRIEPGRGMATEEELTDARAQQAELARVLRLNTVGEMAAGLAHEINQPLSAIMSFAHGCERRLRSGHVRMDEIFVALAAIGEQAERSSNVIRRLRRFLAREKASFEPLDINELVRESVALVGSDSSARGVRFSVDLDPDLPPIAADSVQIEQVMINLLRNGLEAAASGHDSEVSVVVRSSLGTRGEVEVSVSDSGDGVDGASVEGLFEPFFTTKKDGLGMGLSISRSIIESHGGHIWAGAAEEGGLRVSFSLEPITGTKGGVDGN